MTTMLAFAGSAVASEALVACTEALRRREWRSQPAPDRH
jgi:hypothetical protein